MRIIIFEATAEELRANKRVADVLVDTLSDFMDSVARCDYPQREDEEVQND